MFTSKSAPANMAERKSQFCKFAFLRVATRKFTAAMLLPSRFAPVSKTSKLMQLRIFLNQNLDCKKSRTPDFFLCGYFVRVSHQVLNITKIQKNLTTYCFKQRTRWLCNNQIKFQVEEAYAQPWAKFMDWMVTLRLPFRLTPSMMALSPAGSSMLQLFKLAPDN